MIHMWQQTSVPLISLSSVVPSTWYVKRVRTSFNIIHLSGGFFLLLNIDFIYSAKWDINENYLLKIYIVITFCIPLWQFTIVYYILL